MATSCEQYFKRIDISKSDKVFLFTTLKIDLDFNTFWFLFANLTLLKLEISKA